MKLIIVYGPPAAGKLTVSKELAKATGFEIFHNHATYDLYHQVMKEQSEEFWDRVGKLRFELIELAAKNDVNLIFTICYEPDDIKYIQKIKKSVGKHNGEVYYVHLVPNEKELLKRVVSESRKQYKKLKDPEVLSESLKKHEYYESIAEPNSIRVDNSSLTPRQVVKRITDSFRL